MMSRGDNNFSHVARTLLDGVQRASETTAELRRIIHVATSARRLFIPGYLRISSFMSRTSDSRHYVALLANCRYVRE